MHYHLILTDQCNSACRYCYGKSMKDLDNHSITPFSYDFSAPPTFEPPLTYLKAFLEKDPDAVLIFYGGEPLLEIGKLSEIMDTLSVPFRMQTNGLLLHRLPMTYLERIDKILVSLDGSRERTDYNRGRGTFDCVMRNVTSMKARGYTGEIIARMTIAQDSPDIFEQVRSLIREGFTSIHWQLDAGFYSSDFEEEKFSDFVTKYVKSLDRLLEFWMERMNTGEVIRLYPFMGIVESLLTQVPTPLRCGAGHSGYAICTDGTIVTCPIMIHIRDFVAGTLDTHPRDLKAFEISGRCKSCHLLHACGGRCLYWNRAALWPERGNDLICETVFHLLRGLESRMDDIEAMLENRVVSKEDFQYERYFGPEIIP
ncbi:MAG: TIGR04084 family radical SAM/SPASM domain-containing protein [Theionarchaea archaeon]|nr:TIGR04084 family radical SAM/SPASM domain-containing protein [Theionarchaea archaeon]